MAYTDINSEDRLVQQTFADHLRDKLGWESVYAYTHETFGPASLLGRADTREAVLTRDALAALRRLNPHLPESALTEALHTLTQADSSRSLLQHNQIFYGYIRDGIPVSYKNAQGQLRDGRARIIDFANGQTQGVPNNRFLAVRELKLTGLRAPSYNRRADLVCFVNGLPLVFIELKAVYLDIRAAFDNNLRDYLDENVIAHAFHHNAFVIVSNGQRARYGSITSGWEHFAEWKRLDEKDEGNVDAEVLLNGMLKPERLLDLVENFILFDSSKPGAVRKVVARNHQVLGVNQALASVRRQEALKAQIPLDQRLKQRLIAFTSKEKADLEALPDASTDEDSPKETVLSLPESAHPDLGKLGVFWHTQGSGKSYSMAFFTEKVRRQVSGKFTFLLMTDRHDLDGQIYRTFVGCGITPEQTPRASTGEQLKTLLSQNHGYIFSLIHKFNQEVKPDQPYSSRDDIIVISDEAHRTQSGKLARNLRLALPNAAFLGFTGTPIFKNDHLTRRIFGKYVSTYNFKRSEQDGATVKLIYENRGEKLGIARLDLNDKIAAAIEQAKLSADQEASLQRLLGKDYEVITAGDRLDKIAQDFVEHCTTRWESGKSMLVCIDKVTCARMYQKIIPLWQAKLVQVRGLIPQWEAELADCADAVTCEAIEQTLTQLRGQKQWIEETIIAIIISEAQNEGADFKKWDFDIIPHRALIKQGFNVDEKQVDVETAFKNPQHPFRIAIVCAMWLTGFDVESLSTLYIDKPMKAHTLMQAIARANRVYPGKDFGLIVDYNGMLKSLREALAQYALGDEGANGEEIVAPIETRLVALHDAIEETEKHLRGLGFDAARLNGAKGFVRIAALADATEAVYQSDESKRRFEILARQVFIRFKSLLTERAVYAFAERHDNIEAIYKKLQERRNAADITDVLKALQQIVNDAIRAEIPEVKLREGNRFDLSGIDLERLRDEFAKKVKHKATVIQDIRQIVEDKLAHMLAQDPERMDYYRRYMEIIADYNREKDRVTIEDTFARLSTLVRSLDAEQRRAAEEGLSEEELALFKRLLRDDLGKAERERVKQASQELLSSLERIIASLQEWTRKEQTQSEVQTYILDYLYTKLPTPPYTNQDKDQAAQRVYQFVLQQSAAGRFGAAFTGSG